MDRLNIAILAQALEDALRHDLNKPITGGGCAYDSYTYLRKYPKVFNKLIKSSVKEKRRWLCIIERELNEDSSA